MQLASRLAFPEPLLAAMPQLREKPHLGFRSKNPAWHPGFNVCNSTAVLGLQFRCSETVSGPVVAPNNPVVLQNPCQVQGRALPPSAFAQAGSAANGSLINLALDAKMGFPAGHYLDPQPLASGNVFQKQAYGNYTFGVYMASAGVSLNTALSGASAYALKSGAYFTYIKNGYQMDPNYPLLPAANVGNIANGYNAQANGTTCHN